MHDLKYSSTARVLHWLMAVLILLTIPAGFIMAREGVDRGLQDALYLYHKNVGVLLLLLVVVRLGWRMISPPPPLPAGLPDWQARIAGLTHAALYALLIVMPIAGYVRVKAGGFPIESLDALGVPSLVPRSDALAGVAQTVHFYGALAITAAACAHIGAGLFHGIVKQDGVFSRIWPPVGGGTR